MLKIKKILVAILVFIGGATAFILTLLRIFKVRIGPLLKELTVVIAYKKNNVTTEDNVISTVVGTRK